jgi:hypothetical protein
MTDPQFEWLEYRLLTDEGVTYENPPPKEFDTNAFSMRLSDGVARGDSRED